MSAWGDAILEVQWGVWALEACGRRALTFRVLRLRQRSLVWIGVADLEEDDRRRCSDRDDPGAESTCRCQADARRIAQIGDDRPMLFGGGLLGGAGLTRSLGEGQGGTTSRASCIRRPRPAIGLVLASCRVALPEGTGYLLNPVRDFGTRIAC